MLYSMPFIQTDPSQTSSTTAATLVSNTHATISIVMATTLMSGVSDTSKTVPTLDSSTQPVYSVAMMSPTTTHVTMATTDPSLIVSKVIGVTSRVAITTNVAMPTTAAMITGTVTVTPSSANSELNSSKIVPAPDSSIQAVYSVAMMSPTTSHVTKATTAPSLIVHYTLVSNTHATTSIVMTATQMSSVSHTSKTVPTLDSSTQPVYSAAMMSPSTTHIIMATTAPSLIVSKVIGVTSTVAITTNFAMTTSDAMTTGIGTVTPSSNSELHSSKVVVFLSCH